MRIAFCNSEYCDICGGNPQRCGLLHNGIAGLCSCYSDGGGG